MAPTDPRCRHDWSEDYVCTKCGSIRLAAEPYWARVHPWQGKRGARPVWLALWTCADTDTTEPSPVYPGNRLLCERTGGLSKRAVQGYLVELQAMGWIRAAEGDHAREFEMAWSAPREDWGAEFRAKCEGSRTPHEESRIPEGVKDPAPRVKDPAPYAKNPAPPHAESRTHTLQGDLGVDLPNDLPQLSLVEPVARDGPREVFDHLRARIIATKRDLGVKPATGPRVLNDAQRRAIAARIREHGGDGVTACKRVIDVGEAKVRSRPDFWWQHWNATTPFRPSKFEKWLAQWREDGDHAVGGERSRGSQGWADPPPNRGELPPLLDASAAARLAGSVDEDTACV